LTPVRRLLLDAVVDLVGEEGAGALIGAGDVLVDGMPVRTPRSRLRPGATITFRRVPVLRGSAKLRAALATFPVTVLGRVALDVGASTGGFTTALLEAGAVRVYAVDAGHGQLLGSLRQDPRVVNLEALNVGELDTSVIPEAVEVVTVDVSYLSLRAAVAQLDRIVIGATADLVGLVKPMFELQRATAPNDRVSLDAALAGAVAGVEASGWHVLGTMDSPVTGSRGAAEMLLWAQRR
jgi:23S rRNA (cytidine1920-2'-O)/16S rRNA (cytidine1409-2'-O)-methyltransferase